MKRLMIPAMVMGITAAAFSATSMAQGRYEGDQGAVGNMHAANIQALVADGQSQAMTHQIERDTMNDQYTAVPEAQVKALVADGQSDALAELTQQSAQSHNEVNMQHTSSSQNGLSDVVSEGHSAAEQEHIQHL